MIYDGRSEEETEPKLVGTTSNATLIRVAMEGVRSWRPKEFPFRRYALPAIRQVRC
jgi:hypothetical protein